MSATFDETRVEAFAGLVATDVGAALNTALVALCASGSTPRPPAAT